MYHLDREASIYCEWGAQGIEALREHVDVFVIVDVLSFSTSVDIAVSRGAKVYPYPYKDDTAMEYAKSLGAECASLKRSKSELSLSSCSLQRIASGTSLVLPSPNGSHLSRLTGDLPTLCGSLRNAKAVAVAAHSLGSRIGVIAAGERWDDDSMRFAIEDLIGAGAIISELQGERSEEAIVAMNAFASTSAHLLTTLLNSVSGRELIERGFPEDVELAAQLNISTSSPRMVSFAYV
jgi:2-phosphosulfolactate phosphatase